MFNTMLNMKRLTLREFQHRLGRISATLKPGQTIEVTKRGKVEGYYQKAPKVKRPNFLENLRKTGIDPKVGAAMIAGYDAW